MNHLPDNPNELESYVNRMLVDNPSEIPRGVYALPSPDNDEEDDNHG